jgi:hypothetical protein
MQQTIVVGCKTMYTQGIAIITKHCYTYGFHFVTLSFVDILFFLEKDKLFEIHPLHCS